MLGRERAAGRGRESERGASALEPQELREDKAGAGTGAGARSGTVLCNHKASAAKGKAPSVFLKIIKC